MEDFIKLKRYLNSIEVTIKNDGIFIVEKSLTKYHEYNLDFEHLGIKKIVKREMSQGILVLLGGFSLIMAIKILILVVDSRGGISTGIFVFISAVLLLLAILTRKRSVILPTSYDHNSLELPFNESNEKQVREFTDLIISRTKEYLISKYAKVDKDMPLESQYEKISSLKDRDILSEEEFNRLKKILLDKDKKIGF
jgi:hypothetical protein